MILRWAQWAEAFFARHWLALLLSSLLLFTVAPFLAPVAMAAGWTGAGGALYWFYSFFCHQLPQRSWFLFGPKLTYTLAELQQFDPAASAWALRSFVGSPELGWKVAWSDRMISFYTMTPVFGLVYALLRTLGLRTRPLPVLVMALLLLPLALDGGTHAVNDLLTGMADSGFRDTNGWLQSLTNNALPGFYAGDQFGSFNWWARLITGLLAAAGVAFYTLPSLDQFMAETFRASAKSRTATLL